jgi:DNA-binding transcriptional regulator LsrR (DeoR family)
MIPSKSSDLLIKIMKENDFTVPMVAQKLGVSRRSIHRLLKGGKPSGKLVVSLIALYLHLNSQVPGSR